ncbi:MAG TPA: GNAT family N-acetyltransferase [Jatrophihabitantaceae bacterium]|nr:GNAT family N-acetyltransferase [Jatrophihabitantaceae bacterium]
MTAARIGLRPMVEDDLALIAGWLREPHVARWWREDPDTEIDGYRRCIEGIEPTVALIAVAQGGPVGWCQWYRWSEYPQSSQFAARPGDLGIDYAIGVPDAVGRGLGTELIGVLLGQARIAEPSAPVLVAVDVANTASRRVLEKNGFRLVGVRGIECEPEDLSALYRLD